MENNSKQNKCTRDGVRNAGQDIHEACVVKAHRSSLNREVVGVVIRCEDTHCLEHGCRPLLSFLKFYNHSSRIPQVEWLVLAQSLPDPRSGYPTDFRQLIQFALST